MLLLWCWYDHNLYCIPKGPHSEALRRTYFIKTANTYDSARSLDSVDSDDGLIHE